MKWISTFVFGFLYLVSSAQVDTSKLNKYFSQLELNNKVMASVCLYDKGLFIYDHAGGLADVEKNKKANIYTQYRIGSISKMFTAVMILQLVEEKKLSLQTSLSTFFPTIKNSGKITIEHLLMHRSGIENFTKEQEYTGYMETPKSEAELIHIFEKLSSDFAPDAQFSYSNTNYVLLTFILEKVTKSTYAEQLLRRICAKALLADTKVGEKINTHANEAQSYTLEDKAWIKTTETDMSIPRGAGNIVSTSKDLCLFMEALFEGKFISKPMLEKMKQMKQGYGYGMVQYPFGSKKFYGHTGGIDNFQSILGYNEEDKIAFCILGNGFAYSINDIAIAVLSAYYLQPYDIPNFEKRLLTDLESKSEEGVYYNAQLDMKINIFKKDSNLMAQASGQSAIVLEKVSALQYRFIPAGIEIIFNKKKEDNIPTFTLKQGGKTLIFDKE